MVDRQRHVISEADYEAGKERRILPHRIRPLGIFTLRALRRIGSDDHAFEVLIDIFSISQVIDDLYKVDFIELPDYGDQQDQESYFSGDGFMVINNVNPHLPNLPDVLEIGYILERDFSILR